MAFSQVILGTLDLGGAKLVHGTWNCGGATTTGTIDIRGVLGVTATKIPHQLIGGAANNHTTATELAALWSSNGTCAMSSTAGDTGTWYMILK